MRALSAACSLLHGNYNNLQNERYCSFLYLKDEQKADGPQAASLNHSESSFENVYRKYNKM